MRKQLFILTFISITFLLKGQSMQSITPSIPTSPQAEAIQRYGEYAINYSTGVPDISIPLYEINHRGYKLPLILKYSPQPLRPGYNYQVVGHGWGLSVNSCISRSIEGRPDEWPDQASDNQISFQLCNPNNITNNFNTLYKSNPSSLFLEHNFVHDKFNAILPNGSSFDFVIDQTNGLVFTVSDGRQVKIQCDYTSGNINSFVVIDEQGVKYTFADGDTPYYESVANTPYNSSNVSWQLTRIDLPYSTEPILFSYGKEMQTNTYFPVTWYEPYIKLGENRMESSVILTNEKGVESNSCGYKMKLLTSISYGSNVINLTYTDNNGYVYINKISIADGSTSIRNILLGISRQAVRDIANQGNILPLAQLDSVMISGNNLKTIQKYECQYNIISEFNSTDHWGYLNHNGTTSIANFNLYLAFIGAVNNDASLTQNGMSMVTKDTSDSCPMPKIKLNTNSLALRQPLGPDVHGIMTVLKYPTGGYTKFEFENHQFLTSTNSNGDYIPDPKNRQQATAGGFRIRTITNYTKDNVISGIKNFRYGIQESGLGEATADPNLLTYMNCSSSNIYYIPLRNIFLGLDADNTSKLKFNPTEYLTYTDQKTPVWEATFSALNFRRLLHGRSPVVYPVVTVYDGISVNNQFTAGKTVYKYNVYTTTTDYLTNKLYDKYFFETPHYYGNVLEYESQSYLYNQLQERTDYKYVEGVFKPVKKDVSSWTTNKIGSPDYVFKSLYHFSYTPNSVWIPELFGGKNNNLGISLLSGKTTTAYNDAGDSIQSWTTYVYNSKNQMIRQEVASSNSQYIANLFTYPEINTAGTTPAVIQQMVNSNIISPILKDSVIVGNSILYYPVSGKKIDYGSFTARSSTLLMPAKAYSLDMKSTGSQYAFQGGVVSYSANGNPLEYVAKDSVHTCYIWGYNDRYMVASVVNASHNTSGDIISGSNTFTKSKIDAISGFSGSDADLISKLIEIRTTLPAAQVTTYTYTPSIGMTSATNPRGVRTNYTYDTFNRLYLARNDDKNIIGRYGYGYQNAPDNGQGGYANLTASVSTGATSYIPGANGTVMLSSISGGSNSYSYNWYLKNNSDVVLASDLDTDSNSFSFTCSESGILKVICLIIDDESGQTVTATQTIPCYNNPTASTTIGASYYMLSDTGSATVTPGSGSGNYSYSWFINGTTAGTSATLSFTCSTTGVQTIKCIVTDNVTGQTATDTKTVTCYNVPTASVAIGASYYMFGATGSATVTPGSGSGNCSYSWFINGTAATGTSATLSFTCSTTGVQTIKCIVTDNVTGQTATDTKTVTCYNVPTAFVAIGATYYMLGATGSATVTPGSGSANYSYSWFINGTAAGTSATLSFTCSTTGVQTIKCIVTDNVTGQTATDTKTVTCYNVPTASVAIGATYYMLGATGSATVTPGSGSANYSYSWFINGTAVTGTSATLSFTCSTTGVHTIKCIVTDNVTGQTATDTKTVTCYAVPTATVSIGAAYYRINVGGSATVAIGGGSNNFSYAWSLKNSDGTVLQTGTSSSFSFTASQVGTLTVQCVVTDNATGQTTTDTKTVICYGTPTAGVTVGASYYMLNGTGSATVSAGSGSNNFSYAWSLKNSSGTVLQTATTCSFSFTASQAGTLTVQCVVTDNLTGLTATDSKTVTCYTLPTAAVTIGASYYMLNGTGSATVSAGGGSGNYAYAWSLKNSGGTVLQTSTSGSFSFTASQAGTLTVQCVVTDNTTGQTATNSKTVACYTLPTAAVTIAASWYMLNGTGSATVSAGNGSNSFSYAWSLKNIGGTVLQTATSSSFSFTASQAGTLTVQCVVTDNVTGQTATDTKTVTCYNVPTASVTIGASYYMLNGTGSATVSAGNGSNSFSYAWSLKNSGGTVLQTGTSSSFSFTASQAGTLTVQCVVTDNVTEQTATDTKTVTCYTVPAASVTIGASYYMLGATGSATVTTGSGSGNYSYSWMLNGTTSSVTTNTLSFTCSSVGTQTIRCIVTDNVTGQTVSDAKTVTCYNVPTASVGIGASYYMLGATGSATVTPGSGSGNYSYSWFLNGTAATGTSATLSFTCSSVGTQTIKCIVTDNITGQTVTATNTVVCYNVPTASVSIGASYYMLNGAGSATVSAGGGSGNYAYAWSLKNSGGTVLQTGTSSSFSFTASQAGTLTVQCVVTDNATGQTATNSKTVTCYTLPTAGVTIGSGYYMLNDAGSATVSAGGGSGNYAYAWSLKNSGGTVLQTSTSGSFSFTASQAGTLTVQCVVTDNVTGQTVTNSKTVTCYTLPTATIATGAPVYLSQTTGTATTTASGGSGNYNYSWYFKNSGGTVLSSTLNTTSSSFSYTCQDVGTYTIQCVVTDNTTGKTVSVSTTVTCTSATISGNFTFQSGYYTASTSISVTAPSVTFMLGFSTSSTMTVGTNYFVATVSQGCQPSATRTLTFYTAGRNWQITFNTNRSVYCQILSGSALPSGNGAYLGPITYSPW